ncbi:MAG TPA: Na+/H+ antiporter NhaA [Burkholderiales bacterium]|nr:Na+/H+ antiporter NhaA [Burkholderiales bacterium]
MKSWLSRLADFKANRVDFRGAIAEFLKLESSGGLILMCLAVLAMVLVNSPFAVYYFGFLQTTISIHAGEFGLAKPLLLWVNDGLMAVFFFLVGLELKREILEGELSRPSQIVLPGLAALGGIVMPAVVYAYLNWGDPVTMAGWAIPAATDIAFAVGVLSLLGNRVPPSLKIFLLSVAIFDDLGAIIIIAVYYSDKLSMLSLLLAGIAALVLFYFNKKGIARPAPYVIIGVALWVAVLKSGIHATLAGVLLAFFIPLKSHREQEKSLLRHFEHSLHPWVAYGVLPVFAFANAGISFHGLTFASLLEPVPLGIAAGLFFGKLIGVLLATGIAVATGLATLPSGTRWSEMCGIALVCGVGFTMSFFIGSLAFEEAPEYATGVRLGVLAGSLLSAVAGYLVLRFFSRRSGA